MIRIALLILTGTLYYTDDMVLVGALENVETTIVSGKITGHRIKQDFSIGEGKHLWCI